MKILVPCLLLLLAGCAGQPTKEQIDSANYGSAPKDYKALVTTFMKTALKDPDSVKYDFYREPNKMWIVNHLGGGGHLFGWGTCTLVNAKNSFGGYTGFQKYFFFFQEDKIKYYEHDQYNIFCNGFNDVK